MYAPSEEDTLLPAANAFHPVIPTEAVRPSGAHGTVSSKQFVTSNSNGEYRKMRYARARIIYSLRSQIITSN